MAQDKPASEGDARRPDSDAAASPSDQNFDELPLTEEQEKAFRKQESDIHAILRAGKFADQQEAQKVDDYYTTYFLARWTLLKNLPHLHEFRNKDLRNQLKAAKSGEVHDHLNALVLDFMKKLAAGNYHPAVRVNAILAIGELNSTEPTPGVAGVPLPQALEVLVAAVGSSKLPDAVRAAAMVGILRHAVPEAGIRDADARQSLTVAMLRLVAEDPPAGSAAPGRAWIHAQAVEVLGLLGSVGASNAVFDAMLKTVSETKLPFCARKIAAESLGQLSYSGAAGIDPTEAAATLGQFAIQTCEEELRAAKDSGNPVLRRRVKQRLDAVLTALGGTGEGGRKGILSLAPEPQRPWIDELQKDLKDTSDLLDDKRHESENMKPRVEELRKKLEAWLQKKPA